MKEIAYIYMIVDEQNCLKVGISKDPARRLKHLQTGHPTTLTLFHSEEFECTRNHLLKVEKLLHREIGLYFKRLRGEWFNATPDQLQDVKNTIGWFRIRYEDDEIGVNYKL